MSKQENANLMKSQADNFLLFKKPFGFLNGVYKSNAEFWI